MNKALGTAALAAATAIALAGCAGMPGSGGDWQTLIDGGKGMENFVNLGTANWHAESDAIVADNRVGTEGTNYLTTKTAYKDFQIRAEFWVNETANSGIYMRCSDVRPMTDRTCHEANIFDKRPDPSFATGAIVWLAKAPTPVPVTGGKWNTMEVTAKGKRMVVTLNGVKTAETDEARENGGVIGLQYAGGVVRYRKVQIRPL
ncbi:MULTISPECIES: 3-keto-disaccharide hydrolase [Ramlibacter]|uniref:DUF1080 domain-containing protein n=1 Tax=Ramlibacter pinisoli TaxID=2682844 RepID=A0A6N8IQV0_9BURK|nr:MULTISPECIES: DUF1080 domain-containing protein [Ramlibacter]MBA2963550.1 DUF1080 domain-containing protein [Ramlibacter sp. CGMCC 1.13660]MVQ28516.1 DUF1080 domain-containing protein [Ramlibacter pinisoli]